MKSRALAEAEALPSLGWNSVLGVAAGATADEIHAAFRKRARAAHPDSGGSRASWDELVGAYQRARRQMESSGMAWDSPTADDFGTAEGWRGAGWAGTGMIDDDAVWPGIVGDIEPMPDLTVYVGIVVSSDAIQRLDDPA